MKRIEPDIDRGRLGKIRTEHFGGKGLKVEFYSIFSAGMLFGFSLGTEFPQVSFTQTGLSYN